MFRRRLAYVLAPLLILGLVPVLPALIGSAAAETAAAPNPPPAPQPPPETPQRGRAGFDPATSTVDDTKTTPTQREFVNADGTRTVEIAAGVVRFQDGAGAWRDIDLALEQQGDQRWSARSASQGARMSRSASGSVVELTTEAGPIMVSYPDASSAEAAREGDRRLRYADALPGASDLVLRATSSGFKDEVVLPGSDAPSSYRVAFRLPGGITAAQAGEVVEFRDREGQTLAAYVPGYAFDSAEVVKETTVRTELTSQSQSVAQVLVSIDPAWLAHADRVFPVTIDPTIYNQRTSGSFHCTTPADTFSPCDTYVNSDNFTGAYYTQTELRVGFPNTGACEQGTNCSPNRTRTYLHFPTDNYRSTGYQVLAAEVQAYNYSAPGGNNSRGFNMYGATSGITRNTTWGAQPSLKTSGSPVIMASASFGLANGWVTWTGTNLKQLVQDWFNGTIYPYGVGIFAATETDYYSFRRFYSAEFGGDTYAPKIKITFNRPPNGTTNSAPANNSYVTTSTPTLQTTGATDPDGDAVTYKFRVTRPDGTYFESAYVSTSSWTVPSGFLAEGSRYTWQVWTYDGNLLGPVSASTSFTVDAQGPAMSWVSGNPHSSETLWYSSSATELTWDAGDSSGISGYRYALNQTAVFDPTTSPVTTAEITSYGALPQGVSYFHIQAKNGVGIWGPTYHYDLRVDTLAPTAPTLLRATSCHQPNVSSSDSTIDFGWTQGTDPTPGSGLGDQLWAFNKSATKPATDASSEYRGTVGPSSTTLTSPALPEGVWYLHLMSQDKARLTPTWTLPGNRSADLPLGPFVIDSDAGACLADTLTGKVAQSDEVGLEQFYPYDDHTLGADGRAFVNLGTGNFVAQFDDTHVPSLGLNTVVRHTYNSADRLRDSGMGLGWRLSVGDGDIGLDELGEAAESPEATLGEIDPNRPVTLAELGDMVSGVYQVIGLILEYTDGDGTTHRFVRDIAPGSRWASPPGVDLRLDEVANPTTGLTDYEMTRPDGTVYRLARTDAGGLLSHRLVSVTDRRGNALTYTYVKVGTTTRLSSVAHSHTGTDPVVRFEYDASARLTKIVSLPGVSVTEPGGAARSYERWVTFTYDASGRLASRVENDHLLAGDAGRRTVTFAYDANGALSGVTDPRAGTTAIAHALVDSQSRVTTLTDRRTKPWAYAYAITNPTTSKVTTRRTSPSSALTYFEVSARGPVDSSAEATDTRRTGGNIVAITDAGADDGPSTSAYEWSANRLASRTTGAGDRTTLTYTDLGLVSTVTEPAPNVERPGRPEDAPITVITSKLVYAYPGGNAYAGCDPATAPPSTTISSEGYCATFAELTRVVQADNVAAQRRLSDFQYDTPGNLARAIERANPDPASDPAAAPSAADRATTYTHGPGGRLTASNGPRTDVADTTTMADYDRTGTPTRVTDAAAKESLFVISPYGRLLQATDREARVTTHRYDERENRLSSTEADGDRWDWRYDANDNRTHATSPRGTASPEVDDFTTIWTYDAGDLATQVSEPGADASAARRVTASVYDADGRKTSDTNPRGAVTNYGWWPNAQLKSVDAPAGSATQRALTEHFYDRAGRLDRSVAPAANAAGSRPVTLSAYAPSGAVTFRTETSPVAGQDRVTKFAYNAHGERLQTLGSRLDGSVEQETTQSYDVFGQATMSRRRLNAIKWLDSSVGYDLAGNRIRSTQPTADGASLESLFTYDAQNRLVGQTKDPVNPGHTVEFAYSNEGRQTGRTDLQASTPARTTEFAHNADDTLRSQVSTNRLTGQTLAACHYAEGADPASGYSPDGLPLIVRTLDGNQGCAGGTAIKTQTFDWDHRGWLGGTTQTLRGSAGSDVARSQSFTYEADGSRASVSHDGRTTAYVTSPAGWMTGLTDWRQRASTVSYLPSGAPDTEDLGGVVSSSRDYQPDGMPKALTWTRPGGQVVRSHTGMAYELDGRRKSAQASIRRPDGTTASGAAAFTYDLADRLTSWTSPFPDADSTGQRRTTYTLDDGGNAVREQVVGGDNVSRFDTRFTYSSGRLTQRNSEQGGALGLPSGVACDAFTYSGLGEESRRDTTVSSTGSALVGCVGGSTTATTTNYDPAGYTKAVDSATASQDATYVYDTADRLISRTETAGTTLYFYWGTGNIVAEETNGSGETMVRYLADAHDDVVAQETHRAADQSRQAAATWVWLLEDEDGNVATHLRDDGEVLEQVAFDPYGNPEPAGSAKAAASSGSTLGYQKAITDRLNGRIVLGPRQYDPTTLRFTTSDTFIAADLDIALSTDELTGNRYLFAAANPVAYYEDGHGPWWKEVRALGKDAFKGLGNFGVGFANAALGTRWRGWRGRGQSWSRNIGSAAYWVAAARGLRAGAAPRSAAGLSDDVLRRLPFSQQRAARSLQQQMLKHQAKLDAYRANPYAYDNLGILRNAPSQAIRDRIIKGRVRHLQREIDTFDDQIRKILGGGS